MKPLTRPLFQFDSGWLFILAGLAVCAAGVLLPAQSDLEALQRQLQQLRSEENMAYARLKAHADFMDQVDRADPALVRRLAAAQLNMVPEGDTPVLLAGSTSSPVTSWIENTIDLDIRPPKPAPISTLGRWANGPNRLWFFGGGIMAVFFGLILSSPARRVSRSTPAENDDPACASIVDLDVTASDAIDRETRLDVEHVAVRGEPSAHDDIGLLTDDLAIQDESDAIAAESDVDFESDDDDDAREERLEECESVAPDAIVEIPPPALDLEDLREAVINSDDDVEAVESMDDHIDDLIATIQDADTYQTCDEIFAEPLNGAAESEAAIDSPPSGRMAREAAD